MTSSDSPVPVADPTSSPEQPSVAPEKPTFSESDLFTGAPPAEAVSEVTVTVNVGGTLGGYRLLKKLGEGGMGFVFEADDARLKRRVAMKVMKPDVAVKDALRLRFLREAQAAAAVEHDYIVPILQVGEENNVPFIVMPFLKGEPLDARLKRGWLEIAEIIAFGRQTAEGLAAAHKRGLIHRDIKPANIWLETTETAGARVKILDFGLARISGDEAHLTQSGAIMGTPAYMAPEQARGWEVDARADLFSLGCVLYEMCTGKRPFTGSDAMAVLSSLALDIPAEPIKLNSRVPPALSQIIVKLLEKDPAKRPASAKEVAEALKKLMPENTVVVIATKEKTEEASPWADIDASSTEISPPPSDEPAAPKKSAGEGRTEAPTPVARRAAEPRKSKKGLLVGGGLLGLAALIAVIIVIIRGKDGNKIAENKAPGGGSGEIKDDPGKKAFPPDDNKKAIDPFAGGPALLKAPFTKVSAEKARAAWAAFLKVPERKQLDLPKGVKLDLVLIPPGQFRMGTFGNTTNEMAHDVTITKPFYLAMTETTQEQYEVVIGNNPSAFSSKGNKKEQLGAVTDTSKYPVESVNWFDAEAFGKKIGAQLPTESQWEYACRAGTTTKFHYGEAPNQAEANSRETGLERTTKVMGYKANAFGLHDMHGNVREWCQDWYAEKTDDLREKDPERTVKQSDDRRVFRGGSFNNNVMECRSAARGHDLAPDGRFSFVGFRIVVPAIADVPPREEEEAKKQQDDWAAKLKLPVEATNKLGMKMILIPPAGTALPKAYYLGKYEVTQGEWEKVMVYNPSYFGPKNAKVAGMDTSKFPVEQVNWFESVEFCNKLSDQEGLKPYYDLRVIKRGGKDNKQIEEAEVKILGGERLSHSDGCGVDVGLRSEVEDEVPLWGQGRGLAGVCLVPGQQRRPDA